MPLLLPAAEAETWAGAGKQWALPSCAQSPVVEQKVPVGEENAGTLVTLALPWEAAVQLPERQAKRTPCGYRPLCQCSASGLTVLLGEKI